MNPVIDFLSKYRKQIAIGLGALALCALSFSLGRFGVAERVEVKEVEKIVEVEVETVVEVEKIVEKKVYIGADKTKIRRTEVTKPDGTIVKTEDINVDTTTHESTDKETVKTEVVERVVEKAVDRVVEVVKEKPVPDWRVGPLVGVNASELPGLLDGNHFDPLTHMSFGAIVERRILGSLSLGAWATSSGQAGLALTLEF
jgi:hypothetical protein